MKERVPDRRLVEPPLDLFARLTPLRVTLERRPTLLAQNEFDLTELRRLKAAPRLEAVPKCEKAQRRNGLEYVDLRDQRFENREDPLQGRSRVRRVVGPEPSLQVIELVQDFLEPELVDLVDDHEQCLIVFKHTRTRGLESQELVELQVTRVGDGHPSILGEGRWEMYSPLHRKVPLPSPFSLV